MHVCMCVCVCVCVCVGGGEEVEEGTFKTAEGIQFDISKVSHENKIILTQ